MNKNETLYVFLKIDYNELFKADHLKYVILQYIQVLLNPSLRNAVTGKKG